MNAGRLFAGLIVGALAVLLAPVASARFVDHGEYRVYYTTFPSMILPGEVAAAHKIIRSEQRVLLNVSVFNGDKPTEVRLKGQVINLLDQRFELSFDEIREGGAIYYLAGHRALAHDILRFDIRVWLGKDTVLPIRFVRRYD